MQKIKLDEKLEICIFIVFVFLALLVGATPYQVKSYFALGGKIKKLNKNISQIKLDISSQNRYLADKDKINRQIMDLGSRIITSQEVSLIQAYISTKAGENGLEVVEMGSGALIKHRTISKGTFYRAPIRLKLRCGYHNLARFLNELEKADYYLEVRTLTVNSAKPYHKVELEIVALVKA